MSSEGPKVLSLCQERAKYCGLALTNVSGTDHRVPSLAAELVGYKLDTLTSCGKEVFLVFRESGGSSSSAAAAAAAAPAASAAGVPSASSSSAPSIILKTNWADGRPGRNASEKLISFRFGRMHFSLSNGTRNGSPSSRKPARFAKVTREQMHAYLAEYTQVDVTSAAGVWNEDEAVRRLDAKAAENPEVAVGKLLHDQQICAGAGSVLVTEALFAHAPLHPKTSVGEVDAEKRRSLIRHVRDLALRWSALRTAWRAGDGCRAELTPAELAQSLAQIYFVGAQTGDGGWARFGVPPGWDKTRRRKHCPSCATDTKKGFIDVHGCADAKKRQYFFCPSCQPVPKKKKKKKKKKSKSKAKEETGKGKEKAAAKAIVASPLYSAESEEGQVPVPRTPERSECERKGKAAGKRSAPFDVEADHREAKRAKVGVL